MSDLMSERDVGKYIQEKILSAKKRGETEITLISGDIQKELFLQDGLEEICIAMQKLAEPGEEILRRPKSLRTTGLAIKYHL